MKTRSLQKTFRTMMNMMYLYLMFLPVLVYYILFHYMPMYGITLAFKDFRISEGINGSPWVGFKNFQSVFAGYDFYKVLKNTVIISALKIFCGFPFPIIFALLLNELQSRKYKSVIQTISYLPYLMSWVILGSIIIEILSPSRGMINYIITSLGGESIYFMTKAEYFRSILVISGIWHSVGWNAVIYLAAIAGIDVEQYQSARINGAGRFQIAAGIGEVCDQIPALRDSVDSALKALSMGFYLGLDEIISFRQIKLKIIQSVDRSASKKHIDEIAVSLLSGDYCSTATRLRALYAWILTQGYYEVDLLIMKSLEIYQALLAQTEKMQLSLTLPDEATMFARLRSCQTYNELIQTIEQPLSSLAQEIARNKHVHDNELCVQVKKYIAENFRKKISLKEISEAFNLNPTYMSTYFKEKTGVNLFKYLLSVRIAEARDLLKNSSLQITEISDQVGFSDYRYFCTAFKKETGYTPLKYRLKKYI